MTRTGYCMGQDRAHGHTSFDWTRLSPLRAAIEHFAMEAGDRLTASQLLDMARVAFETDLASERVVLLAMKRMLDILKAPAAT